MSSPRVSVVMPAYNAQAFIAAALDSALAQTFSDLEVLVVDDGATDATGSIADDYARRDARVRVFHQANAGLCGARNTAIAHARGAYLALLDSDDVWHPNHLADSVARLDADPALGLVHANIRRIDALGKDLGVPVRHWDAWKGREWGSVFLRREHVSCPTVVFRRDVVQRVGDFDLHFNRLGCEDRDLWLRIAAVAPIAYIDAVHADYRQHGNNMSKLRDKMQQARLRLIDKHTATPQGSHLRASALSALCADSGDEFRASGEFGAAVRAYARAWSHRPLQLRPLKGIVRSALRRA